MKTATTLKTPPATESLTSAWLNFSHAESIKNLDRLGIELDRELRLRIPGGSCFWPLVGREDELRQDTAILLIQGFLLGNRRLMRATRLHESREVERELSHSVFHAVRIARNRLIRLAHHEAERREQNRKRDISHSPHPTERNF